MLRKIVSVSILCAFLLTLLLCTNTAIRYLAEAQVVIIDPQTDNPNNATIRYMINWQNQQGDFPTVINPATYQYVSIALEIFSDTNFTQGTKVTMQAYGSMSQSLVNSSLLYIKLSYDGALPDSPSMTGTNVPLLLRVVPVNSQHIDFVMYDAVGVKSDNISVRWAFEGTHYPTLDLLYSNGAELKQTYQNAPIEVRSDKTIQPTIVFIVPTPLPTPTPKPNIADELVKIADKYEIIFPIILSITLPLTFTSILYGVYYDSTNKPKDKKKILSLVNACLVTFIVIVAGLSVTFWNLPNLIIEAFILGSSFFVIWMKRDALIAKAKNHNSNKEHPNKKP
jgi:hypothetical protein